MQINETGQNADNPLPKIPKPKGGARPGAGRKPNPNKVTKNQEPFTLPKIPFRRGVNRFEDFVNWWHALNTEQLEKLIVYVYRQWPVCNAKLADPDADNNIEKIIGPCPFTADNWRMDILTRYQSGSYCFYVKEGSIQRWTIYANDIVDLVNYPPLIDYKTLMLSVPANKDFVRWARQRNLIPNAENEDNDNMAGNAAVDRLVDQNDRLVTRVIDLADRSETRPDVDTSAQLAGMEMIQRAGEKALDVAMRSADRMAEMNNKNNDPLELVKAFTDMSMQIGGGGNGKSDAVLELMKDMRESDREEKRMLREELADNRKLIFELLAKKQEPSDDEPKGLLGMLSQLKAVKEVTAELGLTGGSSVSEKEPGETKSSMTSSLMTMALNNAPAIMAGLDNIVKNLLTTVITMRQPAGVAIAGQPPSAPVPPLTLTSAQPPAGPAATPLTPFLTAITPTFLHHMNHGNELGGATFAQWLIDAGPITTWPQPNMTGRGVYDFLKESGKDVIVQVLQTHPPIWDTVGQTPVKLSAFIDELLKADDPEVEEATTQQGTN